MSLHYSARLSSGLFSSLAKTGLTVWLIVVGNSLHAQSSPPGGEPLAAATLEEAYQLAAFEVQGSREDNNILPTRPLNLSVYGFDTSVKDTPRSIYQISPDQLKNDIIDNGQDLSRYAPSLNQNYTNRAQSAPNLRGGTVDQYQNGIRVSRGGTRSHSPTTRLNSSISWPVQRHPSLDPPRTPRVTSTLFPRSPIWINAGWNFVPSSAISTCAVKAILTCVRRSTWAARWSRANSVTG